MAEADNWYLINNVQAIDSPALVVYPDRVKANIAYLKDFVNDIRRLRPHVKTHKMPEVVKLLLAEGLTKFKCATIAEAEMLGQAGAPDVLLAYQPVGPKIKRLRDLVRAFPETRFSCLVDNRTIAFEIAATFAEVGFVMPVYLDLNVGMNRTGIKPGEAALKLYLNLQEYPGIKAVGLHAYGGHFREQDFNIRKIKSDAAFKPVMEMAVAIQEAGLLKPNIVAGGSPTFPVHALREEVECSPGTFIFWDYTYYQMLPELPFRFAALVITRVISVLDAETLCLDLGHKAVAAENPFPRVKFLNAPDAEPISQSEEHLVVKVKPDHKYQIGQVFYGVPIHICPTCALYEKAFVVEEQQVNKVWEVASRNRFITY